MNVDDEMERDQERAPRAEDEEEEDEEDDDDEADEEDRVEENDGLYDGGVAEPVDGPLERRSAIEADIVSVNFFIFLCAFKNHHFSFTFKGAFLFLHGPAGRVSGSSHLEAWDRRPGWSRQKHQTRNGFRAIRCVL